MVSSHSEFCPCLFTEVDMPQPSRTCTTRLERTDIQVIRRTCGPDDSMSLALGYILRLSSLMFIAEPFTGVSSFSNVGDVEICLC